MFCFSQVQLECGEVSLGDGGGPVLPISSFKPERSYSSSGMPISIGKYISSKRKECVKRKLVFDADAERAKVKSKVSEDSDCDGV
jgi:hypothetical protein